jgi:hypothetical protein
MHVYRMAWHGMAWHGRHGISLAASDVVVRGVIPFPCLAAVSSAAARDLCCAVRPSSLSLSLCVCVSVCDEFSETSS